MVKRSVRKEGKFNLYRCTVCVDAFGDDPTPEQIKSVSYSNVKRHHESMHSDVAFVQVRSDTYFQPAEGEPVMIKKQRIEQFFPCKTWPREPCHAAGLEVTQVPHEAEPEVPQEPPLDELQDALLELGDLFFDLGQPEELQKELPEKPKRFQSMPYKIWPYEPHHLPFPPAPFYVEPNPDPI